MVDRTLRHPLPDNIAGVAIWLTHVSHVGEEGRHGIGHWLGQYY
jgi:hypothetical protein